MSTSDRLRRAVRRPAAASYGGTLERAVAVAFVGVVAGVVGALSMYVFRLQGFAPTWASSTLMAGVAVASGLLVKLLCEELRASIAALCLASVVGAAVAVAVNTAPYFLLDIPTLGGLVMLPAIGNALTFALFGQFPLQAGGYLVGVVYDGMYA
ncbi:hypothetical protein [Halobaculum sp. D14]|uniref:hypothetical protein n=1 Tax=unclassified Halobaculum TaxID=2640896 RepID=UPI003EBC9C25